MRYFFHIRDRKLGFIRDEEGEECPDLATAIEQAKASIHELVSDTIKFGGKLDDRVMDIMNTDHALCASISFTETVAGTLEEA
jgi:hypothetical protein